MAKRNSRAVKYFYLNGSYHRTLHVNRSKDIITAFDFGDEKTKKYLYSDVKRAAENVYTMKEVGEVLNRSYTYLRYHLGWGRYQQVETFLPWNPKKPKPTGPNEMGKNTYPRIMRETAVMHLRDILADTHIGQPRKDGKITPMNVPTRQELRAWFDHGRLTYVEEDGNFIPVWNADVW